MKFVYKNKWFVIFFLVWSFLHLIFLFTGGQYDSSGFWPFGDLRFGSISLYGWFEFFVYETLPLLIFVIVKLVSKDIEKAIDKNN